MVLTVAPLLIAPPSAVGPMFHADPTIHSEQPVPEIGRRRTESGRATGVALDRARVAELADAGGLNPSDREVVWVRIPPRALGI